MNQFLCWLLGLALASMACLVLTQILLRFVMPKFGISISAPWTEELARYLMVWSIFVGGAVAARRGLLIAMDALVDGLPARRGGPLKDAALAATFVFFCVMAWHGGRWADMGALETSPGMSISMAWLFAAMPVGAMLAAINTLALLVQRRRERLVLADVSLASATGSR